jgi:hypothetical protein
MEKLRIEVRDEGLLSTGLPQLVGREAPGFLPPPTSGSFHRFG